MSACVCWIVRHVYYCMYIYIHLVHSTLIHPSLLDKYTLMTMLSMY